MTFDQLTQVAENKKQLLGSHTYSITQRPIAIWSSSKKFITAIAKEISGEIEKAPDQIGGWYYNIIPEELLWLKKNGQAVKINAIEKELQMPEGTLKKFVDGNRSLPENWHEAVINWINDFRKTGPDKNPGR